VNGVQILFIIGVGIAVSENRLDEDTATRLIEDVGLRQAARPHKRLIRCTGDAG